MSVILATSNAELFDVTIAGRITTHTGTAQARVDAENFEEIGLFLTSNTSSQTGFLTLPITPSGDIAWIHFRMWFPPGAAGGAADGLLFSFQDSGDTNIGGVDITNGNFRAFAGNLIGGTYGAEYSYSTSTTYTFDILVDTTGSNVTVSVYIDEELVSTATRAVTVGPLSRFNLDLWDTIAVGETDAYGYMSDLIIDDTDSTIGRFLVNPAPTSDGSLAGFTGDYTDITTIGDANEITGVTNDSYSWNPADYAGPDAGENCVAVVVQSGGETGATGADGISAVARIGGLNYYSASETFGASTAFDTVQVFNQNPNTVAAWTIANLDAAEFGVRADAA